MSENQKTTRSLAGIAGIVAVATIISKVFGLVRQQAMAAAFGVGPVINAYSYAYVIPGFLLILLGGINGPFHSALVSVLAKRDKSEAPRLVETVTTLVACILLLVTIALVLFAPVLIDVLAPGFQDTPEGLQVRAIAIRQLQIMAPMAVLAGLIGIGFGTLNASDQYWLPAVSPLFSSITVIVGLGILALQLGKEISNPDFAMIGGIVLAGGTLAGATLQWVVQQIAQWRSGLGKIRLRFNWGIPGVKDVMQVMAPATFSSGMLHINVYTDLFFASFLPQADAAAASLNYANLLVNTPLGIISNVILVPLLPVFSRLAAPENWPELKQRIRQGILLSALTMLPLSALMVTLAMPIVQVVYQRQAFDANASRLVASVLMAYGMGMFVYLGRDVLVRVFYGLGDGQTPFRLSVINILLNAVLDYFLIDTFGTPGIVFATIGVNAFSMVVLLWILNRRLNGLPWQEWMLPILGLAVSSVIAGAASWGVSWGCEQVLETSIIWVKLLQLSLAGLAGLGIFGLLATQLKLPEVDMFVARVRQKLGR
ncbi:MULTISPECIES: murein biosynthesis integral membrane protein MurJ [Moorena]|uniref:Probable lipid II flippase MurJ n=1 Tax=Moorena producens 3L TaxID=489825 RepID=F4XM89_9CYAN|nr:MULTISPECIES: murein biosynthesis integral membrane protein MurJ [Moorena]EGJ34328.1 integral membrane protein MviN [Moorena producens 3L]NEP69352.1 murein biosynthesis integral membrane protein MurJ [Moorena sp. SIO3A5]NEQ05899.1 murein biosynthesis integral membrane protein MurJ [Moorena sp. SIO4E2]NER85978.1 murein biosynthesis integral membrane protein MurJ [Moorena sp. SIO3A2]NES43418.1 murein biosynthesis integral membrane protein MurJ [Moorena sp. SIO2C4]